MRFNGFPSVNFKLYTSQCWISYFFLILKTALKQNCKIVLWHEKKFSFHFIFIMKFWTYHVHNMKIKTNIVAHNKISVVVSTSLLQNTWKLHHRVILAQDYLGRHFAASIWFSQKLLFWQNLCVTLIIISTKVFYPNMK